VAGANQSIQDASKTFLGTNSQMVGDDVSHIGAGVELEPTVALAVAF
jgi:hypothetical protein